MCQFGLLSHSLYLWMLFSLSHVYAVNFQFGETSPWWTRGEKQEMSSDTCPVISPCYITCSWPLFLHCFWSLCGFLKALVFALSIFHEPQLVLWPHSSGMIPSGLGLCVCVWLYVHLFFQQNNIISLTFYLAASSIPPEASSLSEPPALRSYLCFSGFSSDPMSAQTIPWRCRSRGGENQRAWLIKETPAKIGCET